MGLHHGGDCVLERRRGGGPTAQGDARGGATKSGTGDPIVKPDPDEDKHDRHVEQALKSRTSDDTPPAPKISQKHAALGGHVRIPRPCHIRASATSRTGSAAVSRRHRPRSC
jgi:hypothetical protein